MMTPEEVDECLNEICQELGDIVFAMHDEIPYELSWVPSPVPPCPDIDPQVSYDMYFRLALQVKGLLLRLRRVREVPGEHVQALLVKLEDLMSKIPRSRRSLDN